MKRMTDEVEQCYGVHGDAKLITRAFCRPRGELDLSFPLCHYEMRGKIIFVPRKHKQWTTAPRWLEFRPCRGRDLNNCYRAWAFPWRMPPLCLKELCHRASASDIASVVGSSFYTSDTGALDRTRLLAWLSGFITQYEAANFGSRQLTQIGVVYPDNLTKMERQSQLRRSSPRPKPGVSAPENLL